MGLIGKISNPKSDGIWRKVKEGNILEVPENTIHGFTIPPEKSGVLYFLTIQSPPIENEFRDDFRLPLVTVKGDIKKIFSDLNPKTLQTSLQIMNERMCLNPSKQAKTSPILSADSALYLIEDTPLLYIGGLETNLIFNNLKEAIKQFKKTDNYKPSSKEIKKVLDSVKTGRTKKVKLKDLKLQGNNVKYGFIEIDTSDLSGKNLNSEQKKLVEKIYGDMDVIRYETRRDRSKYGDHMKMIRKMGIKTVRINVLKPDYVKSKGGRIVRASIINGSGAKNPYGFSATCNFDKKKCIVRSKKRVI